MIVPVGLVQVGCAVAEAVGAAGLLRAAVVTVRSEKQASEPLHTRMVYWVPGLRLLKLTLPPDTATLVGSL